MHVTLNRYSTYLPPRPVQMNFPPVAPCIRFGFLDPKFSFLTPLVGTVVDKRQINRNPAKYVEHIELDVRDQGLDIKPGQSVGILPPTVGEDNWPRYYSVSGIGRDEHGNVKTISLCVKRNIICDDEGRITKMGLGSNFLCNLRIGEKLGLIGPFGDALVPPSEPNANMLLIGTGTGVASFRALLQDRYSDQNKGTPIKHGKMHLIFGVPTQADLFYEQEFKDYQKYSGYQYTQVLSQDKQQRVDDYIQEHSKEIVRFLMQPNTYIYVCGQNALEESTKAALKAAFAKEGKDWDLFYEEMKNKNHWRAENKPSFWEELRQKGFVDYAPKPGQPLRYNEGYKPVSASKQAPEKSNKD